MKANLTKISLLVAGALLIGFFQNCGQNMLFQAGGVSSQKAALVPVDTSEGNLGNPDMPDGETPNPVMPNPENPTPEMPNPEIPPVIPAPENPAPGNPNQPAAPGDKDKEPNAPNPANPPGTGQNPVQPPSVAQGAMAYACILEGPGRSLRVGLSGEALNSQNSVPQSVCMSEKACLEMVSLKLPVKEAFLSGPCRNNANVIHLNDEEIADLVGYP